MVDKKLNLRRKQCEDIGFFFKELDRKDEKMPTEIPKMYNHFKIHNVHECLHSNQVFRCEWNCWIEQSLHRERGDLTYSKIKNSE